MLKKQLKDLNNTINNKMVERIAIKNNAAVSSFLFSLRSPGLLAQSWLLEEVKDGANLISGMAETMFHGVGATAVSATRWNSCGWDLQYSSSVRPDGKGRCNLVEVVPQITCPYTMKGFKSQNQSLELDSSKLTTNAAHRAEVQCAVVGA